jgi:hypothetical protein
LSNRGCLGALSSSDRDPESHALKRILVLAALLPLGACCCGVTTAEPRPVHAVRLGGWYYLLVEDRAANAQGAPVLGPEYARVLRRIECEGVIHTGGGQIQDPCGLQEGDSSLLTAGTTLHPVGDIDPGQRLGAVLDGAAIDLRDPFSSRLTPPQGNVPRPMRHQPQQGAPFVPLPLPGGPLCCSVDAHRPRRNVRPGDTLVAPGARRSHY